MSTEDGTVEVNSKGTKEHTNLRGGDPKEPRIIGERLDHSAMHRKEQIRHIRATLVKDRHGVQIILTSEGEHNQGVPVLFQY